MKIERITSRHMNDFWANMICEHCGHNQKIDGAYNDSYYHNHVIPAIKCNSCGKNRAGDLMEETA